MSSDAEEVLRREIEELIEILPNQMPGGMSGVPIVALDNSAEVLSQMQEIRSRLGHCPRAIATIETWADAIIERTKPGTDFAALCLEVQRSLPRKMVWTLATGMIGPDDHARVMSSEFMYSIESLRSVGHDEKGYVGLRSTDELRPIERHIKHIRESSVLSRLVESVPQLGEKLKHLRDAAESIWSAPEVTDIALAGTLLECRDPECEIGALLSEPLMGQVTGFRLSRLLSRLLRSLDDEVSDDQETDTAGGKQKRNRPRDATKHELVKGILLSHHQNSDGTIDTAPLSTRDIEKQAEGGVSDSTARKSLTTIFGSVEKYRQACSNGTIETHINVLADGLKSLGTIDPSIVSAALQSDGTFSKSGRRSKPVNDDD